MPALAKHFYRVLHNLFIYPYTPDFVMRYLRTCESFSAVPFIIPHVEVQYSDDSRVATSVAAASPLRHLRHDDVTNSSSRSHVTYVSKVRATRI
ncbi:hypothetical protein EDB86DRAFT_2920838, partial [Lactarius hatsudake]